MKTLLLISALYTLQTMAQSAGTALPAPNTITPLALPTSVTLRVAPGHEGLTLRNITTINSTTFWIADATPTSISTILNLTVAITVTNAPDYIAWTEKQESYELSHAEFDDLANRNVTVTGVHSCHTTNTSVLNWCAESFGYTMNGATTRDATTRVRSEVDLTMTPMTLEGGSVLRNIPTSTATTSSSKGMCKVEILGDHSTNFFKQRTLPFGPGVLPNFPF
jgi:hypothetical protein